MTSPPKPPDQNSSLEWRIKDVYADERAAQTVRMIVGRQLQAIYEELLKEPMPDKIAELLRRLNAHGLVSRFLPGQTSAMTREIYRSENGDKWLLARDPATGCVFVKHIPNLASGGKISEIEIGAFLSERSYGPQHTELLRLIGTLVDEALRDVGSPPSQPTE